MKIGIMGLGAIAHRVANGVVCSNYGELYAVASRSLQHAIQFKDKHGAEYAFGSYEDMLKDNDVELVYICTPNCYHHEHIMLALSFHKHVICEKPFVSNMKQLHECFAYAKKQNCFLMEAEKTLFTPLNQKLKEMVDEGEIGELRYVEAGYGAKLDFSDKGDDSWLFRKEDGGSFYDVGVYPICYANFFADSAVTHVQIMKHCAALGYDTMTQGMLGYENGVMAYVRSSWDMDFINQAVLYGEKGNIITDKFWKNTKALLIKGDLEEEISVDMKSDFAGEIDHAIWCIEQGKLQSPLLNEENSAQIMKVLEEMHTCNCV